MDEYSLLFHQRVPKYFDLTYSNIFDSFNYLMVAQTCLGPQTL